MKDFTVELFTWTEWIGRGYLKYSKLLDKDLIIASFVIQIIPFWYKVLSRKDSYFAKVYSGNEKNKTSNIRQKLCPEFEVSFF